MAAYLGSLLLASWPLRTGSATGGGGARDGRHATSATHTALQSAEIGGNCSRRICARAVFRRAAGARAAKPRRRDRDLPGCRPRAASDRRGQEGKGAHVLFVGS